MRIGQTDPESPIRPRVARAGQVVASGEWVVVSGVERPPDAVAGHHQEPHLRGDPEVPVTLIGRVDADVDGLLHPVRAQPEPGESMKLLARGSGPVARARENGER